MKNNDKIYAELQKHCDEQILAAFGLPKSLLPKLYPKRLPRKKKKQLKVIAEQANLKWVMGVGRRRLENGAWVFPVNVSFNKPKHKRNR